MTIRKLTLPILVLISVLGATALSCSAAGNLPNPFASATPTVTETFTPSVTPTSTPTATPTPTFTPTPRPSGVEVTPQGDGTIYVRDWDNQYAFALPSDWFAIPLTKQDLDHIVQQSATGSPEFAKMAEWYQGVDSSIFRVFGMSKDTRYLKTSNPPIAMVSALPDQMAATLPMEAVTAMIEDNVLTGSKDTTWNVKHNAHGLDVGIVEGSVQVTIPNAGKQNARAKVIAFQSNKKLIMIEFLTPIQFAAEILPGLDQVVDTIQLVKP